MYIKIDRYALSKIWSSTVSHYNFNGILATNVRSHILGQNTENDVKIVTIERTPTTSYFIWANVDFSGICSVIQTHSNSFHTIFKICFQLMPGLHSAVAYRSSQISNMKYILKLSSKNSIAIEARINKW
jgi:hypothetical protein